MILDRLSDEGYSDDEDTSWKVRRAATKLLSAIITGYPNLLAELYPNARSALTARFREREETVKIDTFNALVDLIRQVNCVSAPYSMMVGLGSQELASSAYAHNSSPKPTRLTQKPPSHKLVSPFEIVIFLAPDLGCWEIF